MKKILGIGNALTDVLFSLKNDDLLRKLNVEKGGMYLIENEQSEAIRSHFSPSEATMATGGSASNTINGVARLGAPAGFIGRVGNDDIGQFFAANSLENHVTPHLQIDHTTPSGHCTVLVSPDSERTMCTFLGAAAGLSAAHLDPTIFNNYHFLHIEGYLVQNHDLIRAALQLAKQAGLTTAMDMASFNVVKENLDFLREIIENYVDIVFANEEEAHALTGKNPEEALAEIAACCRIAVVKVGKDGSYIQSGDARYRIAPHLVSSLDTTGAGDLYAAGFLYGLANDYPLEVCGNIGSLVSSRVVEIVGTKMPEQTWREITDRIGSIVAAG